MKTLAKNLILFSAIFVASCKSDSPPETRHLIGVDISNFEAMDKDGNKVKLSSFKNGKPVLVNVWATWCKPCVEEMPSLLAVQKSGTDQVVTIATNRNTAKVTTFLKQHNLVGLNVLYDPNGIETRNKLSAMNLPITYITDENMIIRRIEAGSRDWNSEAMANMVKSAKGN